jgi:hypothetical protein
MGGHLSRFEPRPGTKGGGGTVSQARAKLGYLSRLVGWAGTNGPKFARAGLGLGLLIIIFTLFKSGTLFKTFKQLHKLFFA